MNRRQTWTDLAIALHKLRAGLLEHAERMPRQRRAHIERVIGVDLAARATCRALRLRLSRFDARRFMRIVTAGSTK